jgi:hypothetical protein
VISKLHAKHPQDKTLRPQGPAGRAPQPKNIPFLYFLGSVRPTSAHDYSILSVGLRWATGL